MPKHGAAPRNWRLVLAGWAETDTTTTQASNARTAFNPPQLQTEPILDGTGGGVERSLCGRLELTLLRLRSFRLAREHLPAGPAEADPGLAPAVGKSLELKILESQAFPTLFLDVKPHSRG